MRNVIAVLLLALLAPFARAQTTAPVIPVPGDELSVYIMTMGPGDEIFEKFGHNTIRIVDHSTGDDMVYNWGVFDFNASHFYVNFALGRLNYACESMPYADTLGWYKSLNRSIWLQELNLTPAQKLKIRDRCRWWDTDANRFYLYNYYTDNCSTKVRDVLDETIDGQLKAQLVEKPTKTTFRWHTRRLTRDNVIWYLALDTVLGSPIDKPITQWQECFLPVKLSLYLNDITLKNPAGNPIPLAKAQEVVFKANRDPEATQPPLWWPMFFLTGMMLGLLLAVLGEWAQRKKGGRITFGIVATTYTLLLGLAAGIGLFGWCFTDHWAVYWNENLFQISPIALPLAFLIPLMFKNRPRIRKTVLFMTLAIAASTLIGLILSPFLRQVIADPMALILPINFALAWSIWRLNRAWRLELRG